MDSQKKYIGIMGGTFDPFHNAHLMLAEQAYKQFPLDEIWIIPNGNPPHKWDSEQADVKHRINMIQAAIEKIPYLKFCNIESSSQVYHYTFETLKRLKNANPGVLFYFIMGADSLFDFDDWKEPGEISRDCVILAASRDHCKRAQIEKKMEELKTQFGADIQILNMPTMDIASSDIRLKVARKEDISDMVPRPVAEYIRQHGLYTGGKMDGHNLH